MDFPQWCYQMKTVSALLTLREGNPSVTGGFPSQRPVTELWYFFGVALNKQFRNNRGACDLKRPCAHYSVTVMFNLNQLQ